MVAGPKFGRMENAAMDTTVKLRSGHRMPRLGLGTLRNRDGDAHDLVEAALAMGYRHIDTAQYYGNEEPVGSAVARSSVPRDEIWLTTKILHPKAPPVPDVRTAATDSLRRLGVDHVDALLVHWPRPDLPLAEILGVLAALRDEGLARVVGVSNFPSALLRTAAGLVEDLAIDQVEYHPHLAQQTLLATTRELGVVLTAHSPLALGQVLEDPVVADVAAGHGRSSAQVVLRWAIQQDGVAAIPGGSPDRLEHMRENLDVFDFSLGDDEMQRLSSLARGTRVVDPPHGPTWDED